MDKPVKISSSGIKKFQEMGLDDKILRAIEKLGWTRPTLIQEKAIPLLLEGKDVLMRARTGSGKTGAFAIPIVQNIFSSKLPSDEPSVKALVLAPTKELCHQLYLNFIQLTMKCSKEVRIIDISPKLEVSAQRAILEDYPDIIVATPARALVHLHAKSFNLKKLNIIMIDEADLMFSFGYGDNLKDLFKFLPKVYQASLASATLTEDVTSLKGLLLHNTVTLKLEEPDLAPLTQLTHYKIYAEEDNKAVALYALLQLKLIKGKTIVFVNTVDKCYKLKLFLEQFAIKTCALNSELPSIIRCHTVSQFNSGVYDTIIASDEMSLEKNVKKEQIGKRKKDLESGVSRGIDFQFVSNIINFDFPLDVNSYIHKAGRTARGLNKGVVLSFVATSEMERLTIVEGHLKRCLGGFDNIFKKYNVDMKDLEGFKYRALDAWRATTRIAVREARIKEIKQEMFNSHKLKGYFEDNPRDLKTLRHDKALHTVKGQSHLPNVPDYIIPDSLKSVVDLTHIRKIKRRRFNRDSSNITSATSLRNKVKKKNILLSFEVPDSMKGVI